MSVTSSSRKRFFFKKRERLYSQKAISYLFDHASSFRVGELSFIFAFDPPQDLIQAPASVAFSAPKRSFKRATDRNLIKRRMREAYRLHKHDLLEALEEQNHNLLFLIKYNRRTIADFTRIEQAMLKGFRKLSQQFPPT